MGVYLILPQFFGSSIKQFKLQNARTHTNQVLVCSSCLRLRRRLDPRSYIPGALLRHLSPAKVSEMADPVPRVQNDSHGLAVVYSSQLTYTAGFYVAAYERNW